VLVSGSGHGSGVFKDHPELLARVIEWADDAVEDAGPSPSSGG